MRTLAAACVLALVSAASGAQSLGDPDSFGNHAIHLGLSTAASCACTATAKPERTPTEF